MLTFRFRAAAEGHHIRQLLTGCPISDANRICRTLINLNVLDVEQLLGIEHLISEEAHNSVVEARRDHSKSLLKKQKELKEDTNNDTVNVVEVLADLARERSGKSMDSAWGRAAMARAA